MINENNLRREEAATLPFTIKNELLFYRDRLVLLKSLHKDIFKAAHDQLGHVGYRRTHERITDKFYIHQLDKNLKAYLEYYGDCMRHTTPRHKPWGQLQPILTASEPFHTICIDFILALPRTGHLHDCALTITNKFSKAVALVPGRTSWTALE